MLYIGSVSCFVKFEGKTSKNVDDIIRVCHETTLCFYVCFVEFYLFFLDKRHVRGPKILYEHVFVGNVWVNIPKDHPNVLEEGPFMSVQAAKDIPNH